MIGTTIKNIIFPLLFPAGYLLGFFLGKQSGRLQEKREHALRMMKAAGEAMKEMEKMLSNLGGRGMIMPAESLFPSDGKQEVKDDFDNSEIKKALLNDDDESRNHTGRKT
jgi:hypothetical protein